MNVVFDLDGTICDNSTREHLALAASAAAPGASGDIWEEFHARIPNDMPIRAVLNTLLALYAAGHTIELWTARPERYRDLTTEWLAKHLVPYHTLLMRADNDWRKAFIVKAEWFFLSHPKPHLIFEDHPETTRLLRLAGAVVAQVGEGHHK